MRSTPPWAKTLEADLAAGKTLVTFTAVSGNDSDSCSLTVRVRDAVPPRVYNCPSDFNVYLDEGQVKRQVLQAICFYKRHPKMCLLNFLLIVVLSLIVSLKFLLILLYRSNK